MLQFNFDPFPTLLTNRLLLRLTSIKDVHNLFTMRSDPRIMDRLDRKPASTMAEMEEMIQKMLTGLAEHTAISWAIAFKEEPEKMIGHIGYYRMNAAHHRAEIGYMLNPDYWRQGIVFEALQETIRYGFHTLNLHSIEACINPTNIPSAAILEKCGFVKEAHLVESYYNEYKQEFTDTGIYSLLRKNYLK